VNGIRIRTFVSPGFGQNGYLVWRDNGQSALAIDPGAAAPAMADALADEGLWLEAILLTHAHLDHIEGVATLVDRTGARIWLHPADRPLYDAAGQQAAAFGLRLTPPPAPDEALADGQRLNLAGLDIEVRHAPGHSPGHVILVLEEAGVAFVGDVVFQGSIGRTDLPGGNFQQLIASIRGQVLTLDASCRLLPGHGPETDVGHERATNPFLAAQYGGGLA
jgi:hydroxyacylglutathione hydrolase